MHIKELKNRLSDFCAGCSRDGLTIDFGHAVQNEIATPTMPGERPSVSAPSPKI